MKAAYLKPGDRVGTRTVATAETTSDGQVLVRFTDGTETTYDVADDV